LSLPLLCDPLYRDRRADLIVAAGESGAQAERTRILAAEARFADTLDPAVLPVALDGVSRATIRALSGAEFDACDLAIPAPLMAQAGAEDGRLRLLWAQQAERVRRGLAWLDGDETEVQSYPVEALAGQVGALWSDLRAELAARIVTFSTLGEAVGSSCAPSPGGPISE
jgi:hypothetical protein